ncbi:MAG: c-type cytochrome [Oligoflexia bacterium]|nr:c-type cytochrome [Oligoflexia bacterium]
MKKDELRGHNFDGIEEYDNSLPRWWVWLFIITIVFSVIYPFYYDFGPGQFAPETVDAEMAALAQLRQASGGATGGVLDESALLKLASNGATVSQGSAVFTAKCVVCHGAQGQGLIGPNLTDNYWIHGGKITDIHNVVTNGVLEKGMLAWKDQLTADELNSVVAFVWSIRGTTPPNPKAPQGDAVSP